MSNHARDRRRVEPSAEVDPYGDICAESQPHGFEQAFPNPGNHLFFSSCLQDPLQVDQ